MTDMAFEHHSGEQALTMLDEIADLYAEIHSENSYHADALFSRSSFVVRTENQAVREGFDLVTARTRGKLAGFSFGLPFSRGGWWADSESPAEDVLGASKFAVIELDVERAYRGKGLGKRLLETLLASRGEDFATLAAMTESSAYTMYIRWGWSKVGEIGGEGPVMDALLIPLRG
jgi:GNAT superfamily N-acetyltransferase